MGEIGTEVAVDLADGDGAGRREARHRRSGCSLPRASLGLGTRGSQSQPGTGLELDTEDEATSGVKVERRRLRKQPVGERAAMGGWSAARPGPRRLCSAAYSLA